MEGRREHARQHALPARFVLLIQPHRKAHCGALLGAARIADAVHANRPGFDGPARADASGDGDAHLATARQLVRS